ncbi:hypothetical protein BS78_03G071600 [Paspalum vaginatum]|nr:hypothetical protein BS78_03G071600 [Paspalum vaginatum]
MAGVHGRLLLLSALACLLAHAGTAADTATTTTCAPRTCGNLTIAYPFWLPDNTSSSPAQCGPAAFEVDCTGGRASLARSFRGGYKLLRVSYEARTMVVANDNLQTDARGCPVPRIDVSASLSLAPFAASPANAQLVFLFNCTGGSAGGFVNVTCPGAPRAVARLDPAYNTTAARAVAGGCDHSIVPVLGSPGASAGDYPRLLRGGYMLQWTASPGDCAACNASGGRCGYDSEADAFACNCDDGSVRPAKCGAKKFSKKVILIVSLSITFSLLLALLIIILKFRRRMHSFSLVTFMDRSSRSDTANVEKLLQKYGSLAPKRYRYSELKKITESFKHKLGEGGYGAVFSGVLNATAGGGGNRAAREVAVKFLHHSRPNGEEFLNEVISIGRTSHVNIVTLLGFCLEGSKRALVYEYMPNGSLDRYIYSEKPDTALGWEALHDIAVGIARGLEYLHEGCNTRIIHFDIKPQNVLLDADLRPKIADFGMAKLCSPQESILSMADARGTIGFIAPEVFSRGFGVISTKSDVYSYGMLLLEMVGGRSNVKAYAEKSSGELFFFPLWVYDHLLQDGGVLHDGAAEHGEEIARKMALIGLWCIQTVPANRPSMSRVLEMLEKSVHDLAVPPRPYHTSPSNSPSPWYPSSYQSSTSAFTQRTSSTQQDSR